MHQTVDVLLFYFRKIQIKKNQRISYTSRKLNKTEENYSSIEREFLAIVWAIQKFYKYLHGRECILKTDHQPLVYLNSLKLLNSRFFAIFISVTAIQISFCLFQRKRECWCRFLKKFLVFGEY